VREYLIVAFDNLHVDIELPLEEGDYLLGQSK